MNKKCLICQKEFSKPIRLSYKDWVDRKKYCSNECKYKALHNGNIGRHTGEYRNCGFCNKTFYVILSTIKRRLTNGQFCSKKCMYKSPVRNTKISGENQGNWKGGVTSENHLLRDKFRKSMQKLVFERDSYTCQICGERGGNLQVDHIQEWSKYVKLRFDINNCRTLCAKCHYKITFGKPMPIRIKKWGHNYKYS